jgi:hypothetical protein
MSICTTNPYGLQSWYKYGKIHRDDDQPAVIRPNGTRYWVQYGQIHRDNDQPAIICSDGTRMWYRFGVPDRDNDQPNIVYANGAQEWRNHEGQLHRINEYPAIIDSTGRRLWYNQGTLIGSTGLTDLYRLFILVTQSERLSYWYKFKDLCLDPEEIAAALSGTDGGYELEQIRSRWNRFITEIKRTKMAQIQAERDKLNAELDELGQSLQSMTLSHGGKRCGVDDVLSDPKRIRV